MPDDETILPSDWLRRLAERRQRDVGGRAPADFSEASAAAELLRHRLRDEVAKVKADLDDMLAVGPVEEIEVEPAAGEASIEPLRKAMRAEIEKRARKSEKRLRKKLRKEARAAGRRGGAEAVEAATRHLELQVQAAEEEMREHIHAQLSLAVEQARKRGEADARRNLGRLLDRLLADLRGGEDPPTR